MVRRRSSQPRGRGEGGAFEAASDTFAVGAWVFGDGRASGDGAGEVGAGTGSWATAGRTPTMRPSSVDASRRIGRRKAVMSQPVQPGPRLQTPGSLVVAVVVPVAGCQEVVDDEISDIATQAMTARQVETEVLSCEDAARRRFFGGGRVAREGAFDSRQDLR